MLRNTPKHKYTINIPIPNTVVDCYLSTVVDLTENLLGQEEDEDEGGQGTIRYRKGDITPFSPSSFTSSGSTHGRAPSEHWSVISDQDDQDRRSSFGSSRSRSRSIRDKRRSLTAAMLSVLPVTNAGSSSPSKTAAPLPAP